MDLASKALSWGGNIRVILLVAGAGLCATACASAPTYGPGMAYGSPLADQMGSRSAQTAAIGAGGGPAGVYKLGAPYQAAGVWFVPAEENGYDQTGVAGAYGDNLQGRTTSNGERFDSRALTAAHATLPMPAIVEVTNLDNGRTMRLRLNDRGATSPGRVLDVSRGAAEQLGFPAKGTARVRVRYVGPARLDHPTEPLYVAQPAPAPSRP
jgi:rare lipoprotein A